MNLRTLCIVLILPSLIYSYELSEYRFTQSYKNKEFTARIETTEDYKTESIPIRLSVIFSDDVIILDETYFLTTNVLEMNLYPVSSKEYSIELIPLTSGELTLMVSKYTTSVSGDLLTSPPTISFFYQGALITNRKVTKMSSSEVRLVVQTTKPAHLYAYLVSASAKEPNHRDIMTHGQVCLTNDNLNHLIDFSKLKPSTSYKIYFTGRESVGTVITTPISDTLTIVTTRNQDGSIAEEKGCPSGWMVDDKGNMVKVACSNHGKCMNTKCICDHPYTGVNCGSILEFTLNTATSEEGLLHSDWEMTGMMTEGEDQTIYLKSSLQQVFASQLGLSIQTIQIREWNVFHTEISKLIRPFSHSRRSMSVGPESPFLLRFKLSCIVAIESSGRVSMTLEQLSTSSDFRGQLISSGFSLSSIRLENSVFQTTSDPWTCFDGRLNEEEGGIDCGGVCIKKCVSGSTCKQNKDCISGLRCLSGLCRKIDSTSLIVSLSAVGLVLGVLVIILALYFMAEFKKNISRDFQRVNSQGAKMKV